MISSGDVDCEMMPGERDSHSCYSAGTGGIDPHGSQITESQWISRLKSRDETRGLDAIDQVVLESVRLRITWSEKDVDSSYRANASPSIIPRAL